MQRPKATDVDNRNMNDIDRSQTERIRALQQQLKRLEAINRDLEESNIELSFRAGLAKCNNTLFFDQPGAVEETREYLVSPNNHSMRNCMPEVMTLTFEQARAYVNAGCVVKVWTDDNEKVATQIFLHKIGRSA